MKKIVLACLLLTYLNFNAQQKNTPKLVVGIVIDQMRYDYLIKFQKNFTKGGFQKLINEGIFLKNVHYNYIPTYTAPGHASIYTGTTPRYHGIIANEWFDKHQKKEIYCVKDETIQSIGTTNDNGKMSPKNLLASTITDELKLLHKANSKVIGISIKDRSAILPAGHLANAAYWWDEQTGSFITSSFYTQQLPDWLIRFNQQNLAQHYLEKNWQLLLPKEKYTATLPDNNPYERSLIPTQPPQFPYDFSAYLHSNNISILKYTPYGNSILIDLAKECILQEKLGQNKNTDFLCISFSSTDYIGHLYGTESLELEDTYYRLDRDLNNFISFLDKHLGKDNYLLFLTADHAGALNTQYLQDLHFPVNYFSEKQLEKDLKTYLLNQYKDSTVIYTISNQQIFLNADKIRQMNLEYSKVVNEIKRFCYKYPEIAEVFCKEDLIQNHLNNFSMYDLVANGYAPARSGDVVFTLQPGCMDYGNKGTTHGSGYNYDTHIPLIFYGFKNKHLESTTFYRITQLAPTLAYILHINLPNACFDTPIDEVLNNINVPYAPNNNYLQER